MAFFDRFSEAIHEVMVVPRSAPMAKAMAVCHGRMPEAPRPITMPMVADEEWIMAVISDAISAQVMTPKMLEESRPSSTFITWGMFLSGLRPPVIRFRP